MEFQLEKTSKLIKSNHFPALPRPLLTHLLKCHIHTALKSLQGCSSTSCSLECDQGSPHSAPSSQWQKLPVRVPGHPVLTALSVTS